MVELLNRISFLCNILGTCHLLEVAGGLVQMGGGEGYEILCNQRRGGSLKI